MNTNYAAETCAKGREIRSMEIAYNFSSIRALSRAKKSFVTQLR